MSLANSQAPPNFQVSILQAMEPANESLPDRSYVSPSADHQEWNSSWTPNETQQESWTTNTKTGLLLCEARTYSSV